MTSGKITKPLGSLFPIYPSSFLAVRLSFRSFTRFPLRSSFLFFFFSLRERSVLYRDGWRSFAIVREWPTAVSSLDEK